MIQLSQYFSEMDVLMTAKDMTGRRGGMTSRGSYSFSCREQNLQLLAQGKTFEMKNMKMNVGQSILERFESIRPFWLTNEHRIVDVKVDLRPNKSLLILHRDVHAQAFD